MSENRNTPLVSVIVPVYGVEKYIAKCAECLFAQTYPAIEFIFVDDGSPDRSVEILREILQRQDPALQARVRIISKPNEGLSPARKTGLDAATGEYVLHADSDDWMEPDAVEQLVNKALSTGADLVYCDFWKEFKSYHKLDRERTYTVQNKELWMKRLYKYKAYGYLWCKFAKRSLYQGVFVPRYNMHEDIVFSTQLIWRASNIAQLPVPLIHYRRTNVTSTTRVSKAKRRYQSTRNLLDFCANGGPEVAVVREVLIRKVAWSAFRHDRTLFQEYPCLREEAPRFLRLLGI